MSIRGGTPMSRAAIAFIERYKAIVAGPTEKPTLAFLLQAWRLRHFGVSDALQRIALAYALSIHYRDDADAISVARGTAVRRGEKPDAARIFVEALTPTGGLRPGAARSRFSRDARAIRHLRLSSVDPKLVVQLGTKTGEGVHAWAARYTASVKAEKEVKAAVAAQPFKAHVTVTIDGNERIWSVDSRETIAQLENVLRKWPVRDVSGVEYFKRY